LIPVLLQRYPDQLNALQQDADAIMLDLGRKQFQAGYVNYLALLNAEQAYQQAVINLVQALANRYADTAALFQALGGGWWNRPDIPKK
jgi:outer membrane protein TolC